MRPATSLALACLVAVGAAVAAAPTGAATHMYECNVSDDPNVNQAYCTPHCVWDAFSSGHWKRAVECFT